jgi:hypothetical protein
MLDTWTGLNSGNTIADLMAGSNNLLSTPKKIDHLMDLLEGPTNVGDNYGSRMRGWMAPPVTGNFVFWIASDDNGEFWLSTSDSTANKALICRQPDSAGPRQWDKYTEQKSQPIRLFAGQAYYYEVSGSLCVFHYSGKYIYLFSHLSCLYLFIPQGYHEGWRRRR